ncbi:MAG TPA: hypothetical protein VGH99_13930 [Pseudonocardia sp.]|jgi:hypothetical protein
MTEAVVAVAKVIGWIVAIFVLYIIISQPVHAASMTDNLLASVRSAGDSVIVFVQGVASR